MKTIAVVSSRFRVLLWVSLVGFPAVTVAAQDSPGITVSETGVVEAMPDTLELVAMVEGNAELADDAVKKFRDNKRRVTEALNGLKIKDMTVVGSGLSVNSGTPPNPMAALQGQANQPKVTDKVAVQEKLTVTLSGINTLSADNILQSVTRILDVAKDAGGVIGPGPKSMIEIQLSGAKPGPLATFKLGKPDALRQQAYEAALKQARAKQATWHNWPASSSATSSPFARPRPLPRATRAAAAWRPTWLCSAVPPALNPNTRRRNCKVFRSP